MKKIIIFSSTGGGGHTAVTNALVGYLAKEYEIVTKNIFSQVISSFDPIKIVSFGFSNAESFYNKLLTKKCYMLLSSYYSIGNFYFKCIASSVRKKVKKYLASQNFDLVVSDIPLVNNAILQACKELNLPFLLIPTDLDIRTFVDNINNPNYKQFRVALPFEDAEAQQRLIESKIPLTQSHVSGFVIRPDFFNQKDIHQIKKEFNVAQNKPVILLMLGAMGVESIHLFAHELAKVKYPAHYLICTGKREDLKKSIAQIKYPSHISITVIGFTDRISDLMAISDLFITKSGSVSFCEGLYMNLPMILDATITPLMWEQANHRFIIRHELGALLKNYNDLSCLINSLLIDKNQLQLYKQNLIMLQKKHGGNEIKHLINQMLNF